MKTSLLWRLRDLLAQLVVAKQFWLVHPDWDYSLPLSGSAAQPLYMT